MNLRTGVSALSALACLATAAHGASFFDNFNVDTSAAWAVNKSVNPTGSSATFAYDYSAIGIPSAPNSGGDTRGLKMNANVTGAVFSGLSVSPIGQSFVGDYELRADVWLNYVGPLLAGGSGSTQAGGMGIGTAGTTAQWAGGVQDSVHFSATGDGNSSADYRAYSTAATGGYTDTSGIYAAANVNGSRNSSHPYYAGFGLKTAPAAQLSLYPSQSGTSGVGSAGFAWHDMRVKKAGNLIKWTIDGLLIATVDANTVTMAGSNISLNYYDTNGTISTSPNSAALNCIIFDNVQVVPEPGTWAVLGLGAVALLRRRKH